MLCLDLIPGPQDGRRRRNHGAIAAAAQRILICSEIISQLPEFARNCSFFWGGHFRSLFLYFRLFNTVYSEKNKCPLQKVADEWIRTADIWCRKWPLYQLSHNHCPCKELFMLHSYLSDLMKVALRSVTRLGYFLNVFVTNSSIKSCPKQRATFLAILKTIYFYVKMAITTFWVSFGEILASFYSTIWSQCSLPSHPFEMALCL